MTTVTSLLALGNVSGSFEDACRWVQADPMIQSGLVTWQLQEWIQIGGDQL